MNPNTTPYPRFEYWPSPLNRKWYWHLQAGNHKYIGDGGQGYDSEYAVKQAIANFIQTVAVAQNRIVRV
jgi:uncharacterized protein YegP (UPF0339 family)